MHCFIFDAFARETLRQEIAKWHLRLLYALPEVRVVAVAQGWQAHLFDILG